jgi:uncharacterized repeat protein (TIGR01451 family)
MAGKYSAAKRLFHRSLPFMLNHGRARFSTLPRMERLEDRTLLSVTVASSFAALDFNHSGGYTPPDTNGAAGPSAYVETVNQTVALYGNKNTGSPATTASLSTFWFTTGALAHADSGSGLSDPVVAYNDQIGRFIVADQDVDFNTHFSRFDIAVSKTSNPASLGTADWTFYQFNSTESVNGSPVTSPNEDADYPGNFGYNHDATVFTLNMFAATGSTGIGGTNHVQVISLSNADLSANVTQASLHTYRNDLNDFVVRPTAMHDSVAGDPMWLVTEHGNNTSIDVIKMANVLSTSATFAYTNLAVTAYSNENSPLNPNGTTVTTNIDSRIDKAAEWGNTLVTTHSVGVGTTQDAVQWYKINVSSGTPTLADQGRVSAGNNTYLTYPSIDINSTGQIGLTYMKSGNDTSTDYLSTLVTGRNPTDGAGTMQTPVVVPAGTGQANYKDFASGGRAGDLSGINVDPSNGTFWAANEFANTEATANWGTAVANFSITNPIPSTDMAVTASGPSSITAGTNATYTITVTNNGPNAAQGVVLSDTLPAGSTFVSMTQNSGTDTFNLTHSGSSATETAAANIASGSSDIFTLVVSAPGTLANGAAFNNTSAVSEQNTDTNSANNSATVNGTVSNTNADIAVTASGPSSITAGTNATYTITVTNNGPAAAQGVVLSDTLPTGSIFVSMTRTSGTDTFNLTQSGGNATETAAANIASGSSDVFTLVVSAPGTLPNGATFNNTSTVSETNPDPNTSNNSATVSGTIAVVNTNADVAVTATGPSSITAGTNATYTITFTNNGPNTAQGVVLSDTLPTGSTFVSMTQTSGTDTFNLTQSGGSATETATANVASGSSDVFTLVVSAPGTLANGAVFNNTSSVSAQNPDPNPANNSATVSGTINANADLSVTVSDPATAAEGSSVTYSITVKNNGPAAASAAVLTNTLPSILNFKSATASQGTFSTTGGVTTFSLGNIAANGTVTATVTAQALEDGSTSDLVSVSSSSPDPNSTNNSASATTSFTEPAITVSGSKTTKSNSLSNFTTATFTHASGVEPVSAFVATINWGDGKTSAGVITLSGTTYTVKGSHTYTSGGRHTISTTVVESGNSPVLEGGEKVDVNPGTLPLDQRDLVYIGDIKGHKGKNNDNAAASTATVSVLPVTVSPTTPANTATASINTDVASISVTDAQSIVDGASITWLDVSDSDLAVNLLGDSLNSSVA